MKVLEPTTTITDYILALEALVFGWLILQRSSAQISGCLWGLAFLSTGAAAAAGGTYHGFSYAISPVNAARIWKAALHAIGLSTLLMLCAVAFALLPPKYRLALIVPAAAQFAWFVRRVTFQDDFREAVIHYGAALLVLLLLQVAGILQELPGAGWIAVGILVSLAAAGIQRTQRTFHAHLNSNDLYHAVQMIALYLLYRGGLVMVDR